MGDNEEKFKALLEKGAKDEGDGINWEQTKSEWLGALDVLFTAIESFLVKYAGPVSIEKGTKTLREDYLGEYEAPTLVIKISGRVVRMTPVGTLLVGAKGRVDVEGPRGSFKIVYVNEHARSPAFGFSVKVGDQKIGEAAPEGDPGKLIWKISSPPPRITYLPLTPESFFEKLLFVINGQ